ncbi:MAG: hypothetical protein ACRDA3_05260 [Peptostreptococcaceae bacterium]
MDDILIHGITKLDEYPQCKCKDFCKSMFKSQCIYIPTGSPSIGYIDDLIVKAKVNSYKIVNTLLGYKLIFTIGLMYKILYTCAHNEGNLHSLKFKDEISEFILLDTNGYNFNLSEIDQIYIAIEDIILQNHSDKSIKISLSLIAYPVFYDYNFSK